MPRTIAGRRVIVRNAVDDDIPGVMNVNLSSLPENYWYGFYKHLLDNWGKAFFVAELDGQIIGYSMTRIEYTRDPVLLGLAREVENNRSVFSRVIEAIRSQLQEARPVGHLVSIAVLKEYRRMGIGSSLLKSTIDAVKNYYKAEAMYLEVRLSNYAAIKFYEKFGFVKARIIRGYYRDGEDAFVMVLRFK